MTDDERERQPRRDRGDSPPEDGTRSDVGGSGAGVGGVAPGGDAVERAEERTEPTGGTAGAEDPLRRVEHPTPDA
jgi:hypothetical protein